MRIDIWLIAIIIAQQASYSANLQEVPVDTWNMWLIIFEVITPSVWKVVAVHPVNLQRTWSFWTARYC